MRRIACIATLLVPLHALPAGALDAPRPAAPASQTFEASVEGPPVHLSALGMLAPGAPQYYLGEHVKAGAYLGGTAALGIGAYVLLRQIFYAESFQPGAFFPAESNALIMLNAAGISWLVGGGLSTLDAYHTIVARHPAAGTSTKPLPSPTPTRSPDMAPTPAPVAPPNPVWTPTPQPTATQAPRWTPAPAVTPSPVPTVAPGSDPEQAVYRAYDYAAKGRYLEAVTEIQAIRDPEWLPKANALVGEWGSKAVDQGLALARASLASGDTDTARQVLARIASLPRTPAQNRLWDSLRQSLR